MRLFLKIVLLLLTVHGFSQDLNPVLSPIKIDSLYREDQFYFGFTFNSLQKKPAGLIQDKFSSGFAVGFLRDMPFNKKRSLAIAAGMGFSFNTFNQNLKISNSSPKNSYKIIDVGSYSKNKFTHFLVEVPIEFRWRTSTFESHKFWRIYGGFKMGYLIYDKSVYDDSQGKIVITNNKDFNKFQYGVYLSSGYNSINVYAYYGLNSLFQSAKTTTDSIDMNSLNVGIVFYIL